MTVALDAHVTMRLRRLPLSALSFLLSSIFLLLFATLRRALAAILVLVLVPTAAFALPTVTINQAAGQSDPAGSSPIRFDVVFSEPVTGFNGSDVDLSGTAGATTASVTGSGSSYSVLVSGMTGSGSVVATIPAGVATNASVDPNEPSTSTDNTVTYNLPPPAPLTVTINQAAGQSDPTGSSPIRFDVVFSEPVTGFNGSDVDLSGTAGATTASVTGSGSSYSVVVSGMTGSGSVVATIPAGVATNAAVDPNEPSTSTDNTVTYNLPPPPLTVTINQAAGQSDPTGSSPILFDVVFSEPVTGFSGSDVVLSGTAGATIAVVTGSGSTFSVAVSGMTGSGSVVATIPAGVATNAAVDANEASTSTDNTVTFTPPVITVSPPSLPSPVYNQAYSQQLTASGGMTPYTFALTSGTLPSGISFDAAGLLSGIPTNTGTFNLVVAATDANGFIGSKSYTLIIAEPTVELTPASLPNPVYNQAYSQQLAASGGAVPYTFALTSGTLPSGISFDAIGLLSGTPTNTGTFDFTAVATDQNRKSGSKAYSVTIDKLGTTTLVVSSLNPSNQGDQVTFTATVSAPGNPPPAGTVTFSVDGSPAATVALAGGAAALTTSALPVGTRQVVATYNGDANNATSTSSALAQEVHALGSITIRQTTDSGDGSFGFSSPAPGLNFTIATSSGSGDGPAVSLQTGSYSVTAADMTAAGFALTSISCNDGDSVGNVANRTAVINLAPGESVVCTFASTNSRENTTALIKEFMETRASLILENQPDIQRRIDRLDGVAGGGSPVATLLAYLPGMADTNSVNVSASLASMRRLGGEDANSLFDIWFEGTYSRFDINDQDGKFALATFGADYLVSRNLLVGAFVQIDRTDGFTGSGGGTAEGTGWIAGPYLTARLTDNLYFDLLAGAGTSSNSVSPMDTYTDGFDASRWMVSATLQGEWQYDAWTFSPRARFSYFEEKSGAYVDGLNVPIPSVTAGLGQIAFGPGVSYRHVTDDDVTLDFNLRLDGVFDISDTATESGADNFHGRVGAGIDTRMPGGMRLGLSTSYGGIGSDSAKYFSGTVKLSTALN
ncbi:putative Ig domain-containing protein [Mesorhizobium sp. M0684]|uniref:putative Ig domain-containing protein n=2 Tax=unclassified Mesorhizobium TaxID=325217 RepID=UPI00333997A8